MARLSILVPMDGSDCALRAFKYAAKMHNAELIVLNVQGALPSSRFVSRRMISEYQERNAKEALARAQALIKRGKLNAQLHWSIGEPAETIASFVKKYRCSAIVMGSRGHGRIAGLVLGSVATKVIHLATCPVTIVK